jgi:hypothetical protein
MALANTTDIWSAAGTVFIVVVMSALTVMGIWEHDNRKEEHEAIQSLIRAENESVRIKMDMIICTGKLNLFAQTLPKGQAINWRDIPQELWACMPKNFIDEPKSIR